MRDISNAVSILAFYLISFFVNELVSATPASAHVGATIATIYFSHKLNWNGGV